MPDNSSDHYIELMRDSRGLSRHLNDQREKWFNELDRSNKEEAVFELEMLLKALACFGDPLQHPGPRKRAPVESQQFQHELAVIRLACERIVELCEMLATRESEFSSSELFPLTGPLDQVSTILADERLDQETPNDALCVLGRAFASIGDVVSVMGRLGQVPHRGFVGVSKLASREISRNTFFNPLLSLEFRPEYDHLQHIEILHIVYGGAPVGAQKASTLSYLALFRMLKYLRFADVYLQDPVSTHLATLPLAAARSDGEALANFMRVEAGRWLSGGFERDVMTLTAKEIIGASAELVREYYVLHDLRAMFRALGDQLHLELRKTFELRLTPWSSLLPSDEYQAATAAAIAALRDFVMQAVVAVSKVFKPELTGPQLFEDYPDERVLAERLRRDIWMFSQILRGFLAKAAAAPETANSWSGQSSYLFVREFIVYFRNLGYHLLRSSGYERMNEFMMQVEGLSAAEVLNRDAVEVFVQECAAFRAFLKQRFAGFQESGPLVDAPFDRREAAETLRLYLDRG